MQKCHIGYHCLLNNKPLSNFYLESERKVVAMEKNGSGEDIETKNELEEEAIECLGEEEIGG